MEIAIREKGKVRWIKVNASVISTLINKPKVTTLPLSSDKDFDKFWSQTREQLEKIDRTTLQLNRSNRKIKN